MFDISFLILSSGIGHRMKSYEPRLLQKYKEKTLADHLIGNIRRFSEKSKIYILTGFRHERYEKRISHDLDLIRFINDKNYESHSMKQAFGVALKKIRSKKLCIIHGDIYFEHELNKFDFSSSFFGVSPHVKEREVGIEVNEEGDIEKFTYDSKIKWGKITYLDRGELKKFRETIDRSPKNNLLDFEIYNTIIPVANIKLQNMHGAFMELDNMREIR